MDQQPPTSTTIQCNGPAGKEQSPGTTPNGTISQPAQQALPIQQAPLSVPASHQHITIQNNVTVSAPPILVVQSRGPSILVRAIYFLFIGWWLGGIVSGLAYVCVLTVIGLPLGLWLINRLPGVITLRPQEQNWRVEGNMLVQGQVQRPFLQRAIYFVLVGWWLCGLWLTLAYLCLLTILLFPVSFWMYNRVGAVTTLYRS